jgi:hypothetical protein
MLATTTEERIQEDSTMRTEAICHLEMLVGHDEAHRRGHVKSWKGKVYPYPSPAPEPAGLSLAKITNALEMNTTQRVM